MVLVRGLAEEASRGSVITASLARAGHVSNQPTWPSPRHVPPGFTRPCRAWGLEGRPSEPGGLCQFEKNMTFKLYQYVCWCVRGRKGSS